MLVLSRKVGESIMIGEDIKVKVIAVDGDQVKLGIEAPRSVKVDRQEVFEAIQQENRDATQFDTNLLEQLKNY
ncbi:carbon storage regulator [Kurthia zopfii]|uniref:Translational regulator CsrA n=1 Tax=Kurthia zopfii TaxID=1650 RepID=A0A8B4Q8Q5_9BACL|nr:carbon storage regulator CsrA [Kurthia zopfii]PWI22652.1 carbon storage regulator [Kurthia zopfii]TDR39248.1 carbon storage regulator CsrA [Kurthia zopfii]GEK31437.1 carbon storage regulator [Kurthia zopfii]STX08790.1 Carbon storage regulator homolog [Kurthia zopfii]